MSINTRRSLLTASLTLLIVATVFALPIFGQSQLTNAISSLKKHADDPLIYRCQEHRIEEVKAAIETLQHESFEQTILMLHTEERFFARVMSSRMGLRDDGGLVHDRFLVVLKTRRALKFVTELEALPLEQRIELLKREMTTQCAELQAAWRVLVDWHGDQSKPQPETDFGSVRCSIVTLLFAAAHFTNEETLVSLLSEFEATATEAAKVADPISTIPDWFKSELGPTREDLVNLVLHCHRRTGGFSEVTSVPIPESVKKKQLRIYPWDSRWMTNLDSPRNNLDLPLGLGRVDYYDFWGNTNTREAMLSSRETLDSFDRVLTNIDFEAICGKRIARNR